MDDDSVRRSLNLVRYVESVGISIGSFALRD